jgi:DNA-binding response OmpR family regulator
MNNEDNPGSILLIEDNQDIAEMVFAYFESRGYAVDYAADGLTGLHLAVTQDFDAIVLDLMLPGMDGLDLCDKLRRDGRRSTPILMLTARDTLEDKVAGLEAGADDYLIKPFEMRELEARIKALIRRRRGNVSPETYKVGDLVLDTGTLRVTRAGREIQISPIGLKILTVLIRASPRVVSRREVEREVWGDILPDSDTLRSHIYNLRKQIDKPFGRVLIHTVQGAGFRIADSDE